MAIIGCVGCCQINKQNYQTWKIPENPIFIFNKLSIILPLHFWNFVTCRNGKRARTSNDTTLWKRANRWMCGFQLIGNPWIKLTRFNKRDARNKKPFPWFRLLHDDVIKWKHFPRYRPFVRGIHWSPVNSPRKGQWRGDLMLSLICALNKRLSKQLWGWLFETPSRSLWRHCIVASSFSRSRTRTGSCTPNSTVP